VRFSILAILFAGCFAVAPLGPSGCSFAPQPTLSAQSSDQIILRAEQTAQTARLTFDTFVHLERQNEAVLKTVNPQIHVYANTIRTHGLDWITSVTYSHENLQSQSDSGKPIESEYVDHHFDDCGQPN